MTALTKALAGVAAEVGAVRKTERNSQQGFSFRGVDAVVNAVAGPLHAAGVLGPVPEVLDVERHAGQSRAGGGLTRVVVTVRYTLYGPDDDMLTGTVTAEAFDAGDKATAKAMSVAMRTFLLQALCLPTDEPDPDQASYETAPPPPPPPQRRGPDGPQPLTVVHQWLTRHQMGHGEADALLATARADGAATSPETLIHWLDANATGGQG